MFMTANKNVVACVCLVVAFVLSACTAKNNIDPNATTPAPPTPPSPTAVVTISQIVVQPDTVLPGQSALITVTASDSTGGALQYGWHADQGSINTTTLNTATWTAPVTEGEYIVNVDVSNDSTTQRAYATVRVAIVPDIQPLITSVLPGEVKAGDEVHIVGSGFGATQGSSVLTIGGVTVTQIASWGNKEIVATVPLTAVSGTVKATVSGVNSTTGRLKVLWNSVNPSNVAVSTATSGQTAPQAVADNSGGTIVVWEDRRNGNVDIYAQRLNSAGAPLWAANGVVICNASGDQLQPKVISDDAGGALVVWQDRRNGADFDIYIQRIDMNGVPQWTTNGVLLSGAVDNQQSPQIVTDGSGGAIVAWEDRRNGVEFDILAQRVNSSGNVEWTPDGVPVVSQSGHQLTPRIVTDDSGGAIIAWADYRSGSDYDIYAQRISDLGVAQWAVNGVVVSAASGNQFSPSMVADGGGGAVIVWQDYRNGTDYGIYAQRLNPSGGVHWTANGILISNSTDNQVSPFVISSGSDAFIIAWEDYRNGNADIYAQRVSGTGLVSWVLNGVVLCNAGGGQILSRLIADDADGAIAIWKDYRDASTADLYLQRVNRNGVRLWGDTGTAISSATGDQLAPAVIADSAGGAVVVWEDYRNGDADIFAQGIGAGGRQ